MAGTRAANSDDVVRANNRRGLEDLARDRIGNIFEEELRQLVDDGRGSDVVDPEIGTPGGRGRGQANRERMPMDHAVEALGPWLATPSATNRSIASSGRSGSRGIRST